MGQNINLTPEILEKIRVDQSFLNQTKDTFGANETLSLLFVSTSNDKIDSITLQDSDGGQQYTISGDNLKNYLTDAQYNALMSENTDKTDEPDVINNPQNVVLDVANEAIDEVGNVEGVEGAENVNATAPTQGSDAIKAEIDKLEKQREANQAVMASLKEQIDTLKDKIEVLIKDALADMEKKAEEDEEKINEDVQAAIKEFQEAKMNGEDVTPDQLAADIKGILAQNNLSDGFCSAVSNLLLADTNMNLMNNLLDQLASKNQLDKSLSSMIDDKTKEFDTAKAAEEAAAAAKSCDPIGFQLDGIDTDGDGTVGKVQFDFFYDEDNDGKINSLNDFVGAKADKAGEDGWSEIENLDGVGGEADGVITSDELSNAGMKVMVTDENGEQYAMTMDEFEAQYGEIAINSQDVEAGEEGFASGVGPNNFGTDADNKLLSSFNLSVGDQDLTGYQTSDTEDWLVENYSDVMDLDSIAAEGVDVSGVGSGSEAVGAVEGAGSAEAQQYVEFSKQYREEVLPKLEAQIDEAYAELGLSQDAITAYKNIAKAEADVEGQKVADDLKAQEEEKAQQLYEEAQAAKEAEEAAAAEEEAAAEEAAEEDADVSEEDTPNFDDLEVGETVDTTESTSELEDLLDEEEA